MGQSKAKSICGLLQELNEYVSAKFVEESSETLLESNPTFFAQFTQVTVSFIMLVCASLRRTVSSLAIMESSMIRGP